MPQFLYKYIGPGTVDKLFSGDDHFTMKFSLPKNFNDPYELFLTLDFDEEPDALAFYADAVGEMPQLPTTCFSRSPAVMPMWAHYAQNLEGFAIEIDEELLQATFPKSEFGDVDYMDKPRETLNERLQYAFGTGKPRHLHFLHRAVLSAAYFTKTTCWIYENERRMLVDESAIRKTGDLLLLDAPNNCLSSIISGPRASPELKKTLRDKADRIGCSFFEIKIGRSSPTPYFLDRHSETYVFDGNSFAPARSACDRCNEPTVGDVESCAWCRIDDSDRYNAASRNPFRILANHGLLESYIEGTQEIDRRHRQKK